YPQKMQAFFAFRSGLHHSRKFDARGDIQYCIAVTTTTRASQPNGLGCSEVTNGHSGSVPREPAQRAGLLKGDQVGERLWMYAWYRFADVKNSKLFWNLEIKASADGF
ncbi:MAG: hypothetical protein IJW34_08475, partial [Clostridia bacterium]|nr:hypothetical protein [Clostridia bacterium]